jgi:type I restriction enzyme S subunit
MITLQERVHGSKRPDWPLSKLHHLFTIRKGFKNAGMIEDNLLSLSYGRIVQKNINTAEGLLPESFETYQIVEPGNIVMRLTDLQNDKRSLRQGLVTQPGIITSAYDALEVKKNNDPRFWAYALLALDLAKYYYSLGGGVRQSIKFADFPNDWISAPLPETQRAIADFLDRETARIDQLIEKKKRLTELLEEKAQSFAERALESLEENDCLNAKLAFFVTKVGSGKTPRGGAETYVDSGVAFLRSQNVHNDGLRLDQVAYIDHEVDEEMKNTRVLKGDVLLNITGGSLGRCSVATTNDLPANVSQHVSIIRTSKRLVPEFLHLQLLSRKIQDVIRLESFSANREGLTADDIKNLVLMVPKSIDQQLKIVGVENEKRSSAIETIRKVLLSIDRLREFRSALITAAVTGQIDVVEWSRRGGTDARLDAIAKEMESES